VDEVHRKRQVFTDSVIRNMRRPHRPWSIPRLPALPVRQEPARVAARGTTNPRGNAMSDHRAQTFHDNRVGRTRGIPGPTVVIEQASQGGSSHIHTVIRNAKNDSARALTKP
jgi:hypothetical protein